MPFHWENREITTNLHEDKHLNWNPLSFVMSIEKNRTINKVQKVYA